MHFQFMIYARKSIEAEIKELQNYNWHSNFKKTYR